MTPAFPKAWQVAALLALAATARPALAATPPEETERLAAEGHAALENLDYEAAIQALRAALAGPALTGKARAAALVDFGIAQAGLGAYVQAEKDFEQALLADPDVSPPKTPSPMVVELFSQAQAKTFPAPQIAPGPAPPGLAVETPPPAPPGPRLTGPLVLGGLAALGLGLGIAGALISNHAADQLEGGGNDQAQATSFLSTQQSFRTVAIAGYAVAGAAAAAGAIYLIVELTSHHHASTTPATPATGSLSF